jgi:hypothetical protein
MRALRFSITAALAAVAAIAVGLAALNAPSINKAAALIAATSFVLLFAILATIYRASESRAFWLGVSLFGCFYFVVAFTDAASGVKPFFEQKLRSFRDAFWTTEVPDGTNARHLGDTAYDRDRQVTLVRPSWHHSFGPIIHCLVTWLVAIIGGIVAKLLYWSGNKQKAAS